MADGRGMDSRLRGNDGVAVVLKGGFETRPYECQLAVGYFQGNENVCGAEAGDHKGRPYNGFVGAYFRTTDGGCVR